MEADAFERRVRARLAEREAGHLLRTRRTVQPVDATHVSIEGKIYVNFASNDYLGLTSHPRVLAAMRNATAAGSGASPLVTGYRREIAEAEDAIAAWKGAESAVLLPSGYQAAHAIVQTLTALSPTSDGVRFLADKLCHASLIDAMVGSGRPYRIFPHNDRKKLERLLAEAPGEQMQVVLTESIFSMDGDACDLSGLAELKARHPFVLVLDEAHGSGVYGERGAGYASEQGLQSIVDVSLVTLSKAAGLAGGAACGSRVFCEALVNFGRAYVYSTAVSPAVAVGIREAIAVIAEEPWRQLRVREIARRVRRELESAGLNVPAGDSPIIPVICGSEGAALALAEELRNVGLWVTAIRPPTVPRGTSRVRVTVTCEHSDEDVERAMFAMKRS